MLGELYRVLRDDGLLVVTVPNWLCWYGIARKAAEFILRRPVTACDQPVDNWYTLRRLREDMGLLFSIEQARGAWYYPPFAKGFHKRLDLLLFPVFRLFRPFDVFLGEISPAFGSHILAVRCSKYGKKR
jgi:SAM-dependent methyltransferase